jgi:PKD repeat protein
MRSSSRAFFAALACAATLAALVSAPTPAVADPAAAATVGHAAPPWTYDAAEVIPAGDIAARSAEESVSPAEAERRYRVDRSAAALQVRAEALSPATYAGLWVDHVTWGVAVAYTTGAAANVALLAADFPYPGDLRPATAAYALRDLLDLQHRLVADRTALAAGQPVPGTPETLRATGGSYDVDVDVPGNRAVVRLPAATDDARRELAAAYGPALRVGEGVAQPVQCNPADCRYTMYGGLNADQGNRGCTSGFTAAISTYRYVLSAAHCYTESQILTVTNGGSGYGAVTSWTMAGNVDAERVKGTNDVWRESSKFAVVGENPRDVRAYQRWANIVVGAYIGKTGRTTSTNRGYVTSRYVSLGYVPSSTSFVAADMCAGDGDSGGPVWNGTTAWGLTAAAQNGPCRGIPAQSTGQATTFFGAMDFALQALGVTLLSGVNAPPTARFSASCGVLQCSFDGSGSSDFDGSIGPSYAWDFGDGQQQTTGTPTVSHTYSLPGAYTVRLTVADNDGASASTTRSVTVTAT